MIGLDTSFIVAFEIAEHPVNHAARGFACSYAAEGFALAPQVLAEFIHIVSDERRFEHPLSVEAAVALAEKWWHAGEVRLISSGEEAGATFLQLMREHRPGRKRLLDTLLAATYLRAGVHAIATLNPADFAPFAGLAPVAIVG